MEFSRNITTNNVSLRLRKPATGADLSSHVILTEDVFSYVDFWFKSHKKIIKNSAGKKVEQDYLFYWTQAKNFYQATKCLPIESSPLPMYYCMLNAMKAYVLYNAKSFEGIKDDLKRHGLSEGDKAVGYGVSLCTTFVEHCDRGVFSAFAKCLETDFNQKWNVKKAGKVSVKDLMYQLQYIHNAYASTYALPRKDEKFIPLVAGTTPTFMLGKDRKIRLVVDVDKKYFKQEAANIPENIKTTIPKCFEINPDNPFQLMSTETYKKSEISRVYKKYRQYFSYISADKRLWYLKKENEYNEVNNMNSMIVSVAIVHRFSEIVRYKPEQMEQLLKGKENWLIHEFLTLVLDQFIDEIACEITKEEIMPTRKK